ncbi:MAG: glycogen synthase [Solirubrobacteraceae bacterium]|jgi:glycosyltransferase involved in cell wall biosynthesis|nr:glycogen synthase [Solirubrobacteraceae bacterium]
MRILTISNLYPPDVIGGYEIGCGQMVAELQRRGHELRVLTSAPRWPVAAAAGVERELHLTDFHTRHDRPQGLGALDRAMDVRAQIVDSANVATLLRHLRDFEPDVVYLWNLTQVGALGLLASLAHLQVPVLWHLMDDVPRSATTLGGTTVRSIGRLMSRRLRAKYLCCSQHLRDEILSSGFDFGDHVEIVHNWVDPVPAPRPRRYYPAGIARLRIVCAGQLAPHKGVDLIVEAAGRLLDSGRNAFQIDLFGGGLTDRYAHIIRQKHLEGCVTQHGVLPHAELVECFWEQDVFLFPTWSREPFAFAPLEASARGCVPIMSRDCGNAEWSVDGVDAIKVDREGVAIAGALASLLDGGHDLAAMSRRARWTATTMYTLGRAADIVESGLSGAIRRPAARPGHPDETYHLARLTERLTQDWAEQVR